MQAVNFDGKTVYIGDNNRTHALGLIQFFYPSYKIIRFDEIFPSENRLIFREGFSHLVNSYLKGNVERQVISVVEEGNFDFDLTDRLEVLKFVYAKWSIVAEDFWADDEIESIKRMDLFDFYNFVKLRWVSKEICLSDEMTARANVHSFIGQSLDDILRSSEAITYENAQLLEAGFISFIETILARDKNRSKAYTRYNELYRKFRTTFDYKHIALILSKYREMGSDKRLKLIWLLSQFSFRNEDELK